MGEFSFVIFSEALDEGVLTAEQNEALLAAVVISFALSPLLFAAHGPVLAFAEGVPVLGRVLHPYQEENLPTEAPLVNHAIIVGYTQAGREVADALALRDFRYVVIEEDPRPFRQLSAKGVPVILGDASLPLVLEQANVERARVLAITVHDHRQALSIAATARQLNRRLDIIARGVAEDSHVVLREAGVSRVVHEELEVGVQFVRHTLIRFGMTSQEVQALLARLRRDRLGEAER
jgi:CPA2 family monovalent cation:H+ antiporter-2